MRKVGLFFLALIFIGLGADAFSLWLGAAEAPVKTARAMALPWRYIVVLGLPLASFAFRRHGQK